MITTTHEHSTAAFARLNSPSTLRCAFACIPLLFFLVGCASASSSRAGEHSAGEVAISTDGDRRRSAPDGFSTANIAEVVSTPGGYAVVLEEKRDAHVLPIYVGRAQAMAIELRLKRRQYARPLTHDLLEDVVQKLDGTIVEVHVEDLKSGIFVGSIILVSQGERVRLDARPSDALALAVGRDVPIYVADALFRSAGMLERKFNRGRLQKQPPTSGESSPKEGYY